MSCQPHNVIEWYVGCWGCLGVMFQPYHIPQGDTFRRLGDVFFFFFVKKWRFVEARFFFCIAERSRIPWQISVNPRPIFARILVRFKEICMETWCQRCQCLRFGLLTKSSDGVRLYFTHLQLVLQF